MEPLGSFVVYFPKNMVSVGAGAVRKGSLSRSLFSHLIAPTGVVERVYFVSLVSIKHLANEPFRHALPFFVAQA